MKGNGNERKERRRTIIRMSNRKKENKGEKRRGIRERDESIAILGGRSSRRKIETGNTKLELMRHLLILILYPIIFNQNRTTEVNPWFDFDRISRFLLTRFWSEEEEERGRSNRKKEKTKKKS